MSAPWAQESAPDFYCVACRGVFPRVTARQVVDADGGSRGPLCDSCFDREAGVGHDFPGARAKRGVLGIPEWREGPTLAGILLVRGELAPPFPADVTKAPADNLVRSVYVRRVIDGDTFLCDVDLGFFTWSRQSCRLAGINAPDVGEGGHAEATAELARILALGSVIVESVKADKYAGRFDALVVVDRAGAAPLIVNSWLVQQGYAVPWNGTGKRPLVPWPRPA